MASSNAGRRFVFLVSILLAGLAVVGMERIAIPALYWRTPTVNSSYARFLEVKEAASGHQTFNVLFLGDSTARNGIIPAVFHAATGKTGHNLATAAPISAWADADLVREYVRTHPAPDAVIVSQDFATYAGVDELDHQVIREHFSDFALSAYLYRHSLSPLSDLLEAAVAELLPSFRYRDHVRRAIPSLLLNQSFYTGSQSDADGFQRSDRIPSPSELENRRVPENPPPSAVDEGLLTAYLCDLAENGHFPVFLTISPHLPLSHLSATSQGALRQAGDSLRNIASTHPRCRLLNGNRDFDTRLFADETHLNYSGALLYSNELAAEYLSVQAASGH